MGEPPLPPIVRLIRPPFSPRATVCFDAASKTFPRRRPFFLPPCKFSGPFFPPHELLPLFSPPLACLRGSHALLESHRRDGLFFPLHYAGGFLSPLAEVFRRSKPLFLFFPHTNPSSPTSFRRFLANWLDPSNPKRVGKRFFLEVLPCRMEAGFLNPSHRPIGHHPWEAAPSEKNESLSPPFFPSGGYCLARTQPGVPQRVLEFSHLFPWHTSSFPGKTPRLPPQPLVVSKCCTWHAKPPKHHSRIFFSPPPHLRSLLFFPPPPPPSLGFHYLFGRLSSLLF